MNLVWLDELDFNSATGAGELYKRVLYDYIKDLVNVRCFTPNYYIDALSADIFLLSDLFNRPNLQPRQWFDQHSIDRITQSYKCITMDTGHSTCCFVDFQPCNSIYKGCGTCSCTGERLKWLQNYYCGPNVVANIFLSPLHHKHTELLIDREIPRAIYMRPPIDCGLFYNKNLNRNIDLIYVGVVHVSKGIHELVYYYGNTSKKVLVCGDNLWQETWPPNFQCVGKIPREQLPDYYNRAKAFWARPSWIEAMGLTTCEAALCGCEILGNERSGALSWNENLTDCNFYKDPAKSLWEEVLKKL